MKTLAEIHALYRAAIAADDAFNAELARVYGKRAGDMRYRYEHTDAGVLAARDAMIRTGNEYLAACAGKV